VRPYMESHGGDVDLVSLQGDVARLRLKGSCDGCPASASTLELAVKQALEEAAPDLLGIEVDGPSGVGPAGVGHPLPLVDSARPRPGWTVVEGMSDLVAGEMRSVVVSGARVLVARVGGTLLAYRDSCAGCGSPLGSGDLKEGVLMCSSCGRRFELALAGRVLGADGPLQLQPIPLLAENGAVKLAVGG
jgi:nitrite reductase/ring-hydroxylating ferredoxin subunit